MSHGHDEPESPTVDEDLAIGKRCFETGDFSHGAKHVAGVLAREPNHEAALALLDALVAKTGGSPDALYPVPTDHPMFYGEVAARAYVLAKGGDPGAATQLVFQVLGVRPDLPFEAWVLNWVHDARFSKGDPDAIAMAFHGMTQRLSGQEWQKGGAVPRVLAALLAVRTVFPEHERLMFVCAITARKTGDVERSLDIARAFDRERPSYFARVAIAGALKNKDDKAGAIEAFRAALEVDGSDCGCWLDIGDLSLALGKLDDAARAYEAAIALEADQPWAKPSLAYVRFELSGDARAKDELVSLATAGNQRAQALTDRVFAFAESLPEPQEATLKVLPQLFSSYANQSPAKGSSVKLALSSIESPSSAHAMRLAIAQRGWDLAIELSANVPEPDPREPRRAVKTRLWRFDGVRGNPALGDPDESARAAVCAIAKRPYSLPTWDDLARKAAPSLAGKAEELLKCMLHPGLSLADCSMPEWLFRVQIAACLVLSHENGGDAVLFDLAEGPVDWSASAACLALAARAKEEPAREPEIRALLASLLVSRPSSGYYCMEHPLTCALLWLPGVTGADRTWLAARKRELDGNG